MQIENWEKSKYICIKTELKIKSTEAYRSTSQNQEWVICLVYLVVKIQTKDKEREFYFQEPIVILYWPLL